MYREVALILSFIQLFHAPKFPCVHLACDVICSFFSFLRLLYCYVTKNFLKAQQASFSLQPRSLDEEQEAGVKGHNHKADALWQWIEALWWRRQSRLTHSDSFNFWTGWSVCLLPWWLRVSSTNLVQATEHPILCLTWNSQECEIMFCGISLDPYPDLNHSKCCILYTCC